MRIALGYKCRVGKDEFAEYLKTRGVTRIGIADAVYNLMYAVQDNMGLPRVKDRRLLQTLGCSMREIDPDIWIKKALKDIACIPGDIIITDMRFLNEKKLLEAAGFTTVKINREDAPIINHISETELDDETFDYEIDNNGSLKDYHAAIDRLYAALR